jgi:hypothetical protein
LHKKFQNPTHGSGWIDSGPFYRHTPGPFGNPAHGSGWILQFSIGKDLNNPPTTVGGIQSYQVGSSRKHLNDPPTTVGGIWTFCAKPLILANHVNPVKHFYTIYMMKNGS